MPLACLLISPYWSRIFECYRTLYRYLGDCNVMNCHVILSVMNVEDSLPEEASPTWRIQSYIKKPVLHQEASPTWRSQSYLKKSVLDQEARPTWRSQSYLKKRVLPEEVSPTSRSQAYMKKPVLPEAWRSQFYINKLVLHQEARSTWRSQSYLKKPVLHEASPAWSQAYMKPVLCEEASPTSRNQSYLKKPVLPEEARPTWRNQSYLKPVLHEARPTWRKSYFKEPVLPEEASLTCRSQSYIKKPGLHEASPASRNQDYLNKPVMAKNTISSVFRHFWLGLTNMQFYQIGNCLLTIQSIYGSYEIQLCTCIHWVYMKWDHFKRINFYDFHKTPCTVMGFYWVNVHNICIVQTQPFVCLYLYVYWPIPTPLICLLVSVCLLTYTPYSSHLSACICMSIDLYPLLLSTSYTV